MNPPDPNPPPILGYRPAADERKTRPLPSALAVLGFIFAAGATWLITIIWILSNLHIAGASPEPQIIAPVIATLVILALLITPSVILWRRKSRALGLGILLGFGIGTLSQGACFMIASR